jgi:peptidoglycan/xylan/chitin deacetylase (PgdA/CDA1 family)
MMIWKQAARTALHSMGGLAILRSVRRRQSRVLMFHSFGETDQASLDAICREITRTCQPVSLTAIVEAAAGGKTLPDYAVTVTVDDAYRSYLAYGHSIFRRHKIPVTVYAVAGFSEGRLWLWPDQTEFALERTNRTSLRAEVRPGKFLELDLSTPANRLAAISQLNEALKLVSDDARLAFMEKLGELTGVSIPPTPPANRAAMTWDELRAVASDGIEIGCHTDTHPILSQVSSAVKLEQEVLGAKKFLESRLSLPVNHFCYPNGRNIDIGTAAAAVVRKAGYVSAATTTWGMNLPEMDPMAIRRIPFSGDTTPQYTAELLAGLHLPPNEINGVSEPGSDTQGRAPS